MTPLKSAAGSIDEEQEMHIESEDGGSLRAPSPSSISTASSGSPLVRSSSNNSNKRPAPTSIAAAQLQCQRQLQLQPPAKQEAGGPASRLPPVYEKPKESAGEPKKRSKKRPAAEQPGLAHRMAKEFAYKVYRFNESCSLTKLRYLNFACLLLTLLCLLTILLYSSASSQKANPNEQLDDESLFGRHSLVARIFGAGGRRSQPEVEAPLSEPLVFSDEAGGESPENVSSTSKADPPKARSRASRGQIEQPAAFCYVLGREDGDAWLKVLELKEFDESTYTGDLALSASGSCEPDHEGGELRRDDAEPAGAQRFNVSACRRNSGFPEMELLLSEPKLGGSRPNLPWQRRHQVAKALRELQVGELILSLQKSGFNKKIELANKDQSKSVRIWPCKQEGEGFEESELGWSSSESIAKRPLERQLFEPLLENILDDFGLGKLLAASGPNKPNVRRSMNGATIVIRGRLSDLSNSSATKPLPALPTLLEKLLPSIMRQTAPLMMMVSATGRRLAAENSSSQGEAPLSPPTMLTIEGGSMEPLLATASADPSQIFVSARGSSIPEPFPFPFPAAPSTFFARRRTEPFGGGSGLLVEPMGFMARPPLMLAHRAEPLASMLMRQAIMEAAEEAPAELSANETQPVARSESASASAPLGAANSTEAANRTAETASQESGDQQRPVSLFSRVARFPFGSLPGAHSMLVFGAGSEPQAQFLQHPEAPFSPFGARALPFPPLLPLPSAADMISLFQENREAAGGEPSSGVNKSAERSSATRRSFARAAGWMPLPFPLPLPSSGEANDNEEAAGDSIDRSWDETHETSGATLRARHRAEPEVEGAEPEEAEFVTSSSAQEVAAAERPVADFVSGSVRHIFRAPGGLLVERVIEQLPASQLPGPHPMLEANVRSQSLRAEPQAREDTSGELTPSLFARSAPNHVGLIGRLLSDLSQPAAGVQSGLMEERSAPEETPIPALNRFLGPKIKVAQARIRIPLAQARSDTTNGALPAAHFTLEAGGDPVSSFEDTLNSMEDKINNYLAIEGSLLGSPGRASEPKLASKPAAQKPEQNPFTSPSSPLFGFPSSSLIQPETPAAQTPKSKAPLAPEQQQQDSQVTGSRKQRSFSYHSNHELAHPFLAGQQAKQEAGEPRAFAPEASSSEFMGAPAGIVTGRRVDDLAPEGAASQKEAQAAGEPLPSPMAQTGQHERAAQESNYHTIVV